MPDLMSHLAAGYIISRLLIPAGRRVSPLLALFCLGAVLPDLFTRAPAVLMPHYIPRWLILPWHTPLGVGLLCLVFCFFFPERDRPRYLVALIAGSMLHLGLDFLQAAISPGSYYWFFPFSTLQGQVGLFWPDQTVFAAPVLVIAAVMVEIFVRRRKARRTTD